MAFAGPGPLAAAPSYPRLAGTVTNLVSENSIKWSWDPSSELPGALESDLLVEKKEFVSRVCASFAMGLDGGVALIHYSTQEAEAGESPKHGNPRPATSKKEDLCLHKHTMT